MAHLNEIDTFRAVWERESQNTLHAIESLPESQSEFRPDPEGRSLGELAWHLAEIEGIMSHGAVERRFNLQHGLPELARPREARLLAPGYRRAHELAVERVAKLRNEDLDEQASFFDGRQLALRDVLWYALLHHSIHHRGQLVLLCRLAGGTPPGVYGPSREQTQAMRGRLQAGRS